MELEDINTIAVLGAGNMGHGIAEVAAIAGYDVRMRDINDEFVQNGYEQIEWSLGKLAENDQLTEEAADAALERVTPLVDMEEAVADADVVIEAVPEQMEIKKEVYTDLEAVAPDRAIFATNTSSLSITDLSEVTERPERFCGMHFFNPPIRMDLVEVISGAHTADETLDVVEDLADDLGKTPVRVRKDVPGFIVNRILVPLMNEAAWLVEDDVATIEEVDATTKFDIGLPMGSFELADYVGIDVGYHVLEYMHEVAGERYEPCPLLESKVESEEFGQKSGQGFYDYEDGDGADVSMDEELFSETVKERLLAVVANEVAYLVGDDVASPTEIDTAVKLGGRWPNGPAKFADEYGVETLADALEDADAETDHPRYEPFDYLATVAEEGGFYDDTSAGEMTGAPDFETIELTHPRDGVAQIELDRPQQMNSISITLVEELDTALDLVDGDDSVRALLLTGAGSKAFSAGADFMSIAGSGADPYEAIELSKDGQETFGRLEELELPVVAAIDGYCLGGGMELAMCADIRISTSRSEFGQPEFDLGLLPGWGGTQRLQRIVGMGRAKEIIFTAERFPAEEMAEFGFVNEVVDPDEFETAAHDYAAKLAGGPPLAMRYTKRAMHKGWDNHEAGLEIESLGFGHVVNSEDVHEGINAFFGDDEPEFEGQ
ncbi:3-hydroxyacyl-CoA dehydrogenase/enoyl-CoA hydratase family protein [Natrinema hispanicum]|uniref:enoyl-CoA hydratase n=1 Tax=Natrinema hispanicum TaxID=392421 RepID=A0A1I0G877_9EURY|nr:3-hydroxyacyl-CoA dehydrogenase/enoyl-CoA hydratase family protein [Natrinema hispanicum]SDC55779.1 3-hydroxyacyl-CoA dehydrogenase /Enoyl-CoA hydratase [Natrinema hispanicum]SET66927.1 3-hydroxyacyl-CoA dehydrogenase /Enoyl-CoA hydratase [Natrinema hispanicum]